jgi:hypothetical protein
MGWVRVTGFVAVVSAMVACASSGEGDGRGTFVAGEDAGASESTSQTTPSQSSDAGTSTPSGDDGAADAAADVAIDVAPGGNPVGFPCAKAADCQSNDCKNVLAGSATSFCVTACTQQSDCPDGFFCDPSTPGATSGSCVPRSPAHCKTCSSDAECGALSEKCGVAAGDSVKACHVDCTIGGAAACPADYTCESTTLDGVAAKVCRPAGNLSCLDSLGGFCDRVATPQTCTRTNVAGTCVGQRSCLTASSRFGSCGATAPAYKLTCSATDPAGCTTSYASEATAGPQNCGTCGNVCPGLNSANSNVGCNQPTCTFSCKGESYDVDGNKSNGCEITDATKDNHTKDKASDEGENGCDDDDAIPTLSGRIVADLVAHENPAIDGFVSATGSAPDFFKIKGTGGALCANNPDLTLNVNQAVSTKPSCYHLHVETNKNVYDCDTDANGNCRIDPGGTSKYDNDTYIYISVSKRNTAGCAGADNAPYTITGHL